MANAFEWFETCINALIGMRANIGERYNEHDLKADLAERTSKEGDVGIYKIQFYPEFDPCTNEENSHKCTLYNPIKEDKIIPKEFYFQPPSREVPVGMHYVEVFYKNFKFKGKYAD